MIPRVVGPVMLAFLCTLWSSCEHDTSPDGGDDDGGQLDAGRPSLCALAPEPGPCEALIHRYYFDPESRSCRHFIYGGCQGNLNNFSSLAECRSECREPTGQPAACEVEGIVYPSGSEDVGDPQSCNTCTCENGKLTSCTDVACPEPCPDGTAHGTSCAQCGPTDACEVVRIGCLPTCKSDRDCAGASCHDGVCRALCG